MISLAELRAKARRQYEKVLRAHLSGEAVFPLVIPANKTLDRSRGAAHIHAQQAELLLHSKDKTGRGYALSLRPNAKTGQSEISRIAFETQADYLDFTGQAAEFAQFAANAARTAAELPALLPLLQATPKLLLHPATAWPDLLTVCAYFRQHPRPNQYVRNLPLALPTKFIERHQGALRPLLDYLLADHLRAGEEDFFRRFHLHLEEPSVKLRFLDAELRLHPAVSQCSLWVSEFRALDLTVRRVFIIENLTTFLAFPPVAGGLALWGGGFAVSLLAEAAWLRPAQLFYWGDIDVHGFQMLARIRQHYPAIRSLLMDADTLARYAHGAKGGAFTPQPLSTLTATEQTLYQDLLRSNDRLEQEQLPAPYVAASIEQLVCA